MCHSTSKIKQQISPEPVVNRFLQWLLMGCVHSSLEQIISFEFRFSSIFYIVCGAYPMLNHHRPSVRHYRPSIFFKASRPSQFLSELYGIWLKSVQ